MTFFFLQERLSFINQEGLHRLRLKLQQNQVHVTPIMLKTSLYKHVLLKDQQLYSVLSLLEQTRPPEAHPRALVFPLLVGLGGTYFHLVSSRPEKWHNSQFQQ